MDKVIGFAGCKTTTRECLEQLMADGFVVEHLITLTPEQGQKYSVSGYDNLSEFADQRSINVFYPKTYKLTAEQDKRGILALGLDALIVTGWQRLIPPWLLDSLSVGAFGTHGSAKPLPKGRGRSPINWSIIMGETTFIVHLIRYDEGVDSGDIVGTFEVDISQFDTCETVHFKNRIVMNRLLREHLPSLLDGTANLKRQDEQGATYFPKRTAADGLIDWAMDTSRIHDLVRAVTHPFPGAFSYLDDTKVFVWNAQPFDDNITYPEAVPGEIVELFHNGQFLVRTANSTLLVTEFSGNGSEALRRGMIFHST